MLTDGFKIKRKDSVIVIEKDNQSLFINQSLDADIWFGTSEEELTLEFKLSSRNYSEWQTYIVFESLMKSIIGKYMLNGDYKNEYSMLPEDFIDLENKIITWHSDSDVDNVLRFIYDYDNRTIKLVMFKENNVRYTNHVVRIRTSGSSYGNYYQEFLDFLRSLINLEYRLNEVSEKENTDNKENSDKKKLTLTKEKK